MAAERQPTKSARLAGVVQVTARALRHLSWVHERRRILRAWPLLLVAAVLFASGTAHAEDPSRVEWSPDWPRVQWWEVVDIALLTVASTEINANWAYPRQASWEGIAPFDDWARSALRGRTASLQLTASSVGDNLYKGTVLAAYIIDNYLVALSIHQNADVALQMSLMDMQSLALAAAVTLTAQHVIPRQRPFAEDCGADGEVRDGAGRISETCGRGDDHKSFYSGHAAATATIAGLTCVHHQHLPLYGGGVADLVPCLVMIAASAATGVSRVVADRHWASDVVVGWAVGALSGYVLPSVMHYGFGSGRPVGEVNVSGVSMVPLPQLYPGGAGASLYGRF